MKWKHIFNKETDIDYIASTQSKGTRTEASINKRKQQIIERLWLREELRHHSESCLELRCHKQGNASSSLKGGKGVGLLKFLFFYFQCFARIMVHPLQTQNRKSCNAIRKRIKKNTVFNILMLLKDNKNSAVYKNFFFFYC